MSDKKSQLTLRLPEDDKKRIKMAMETFDYKSQNEFVIEAVKFYTTYLLSEGGVKALFPELMKAWETDMDKMENRMGSLLFKTALELNMLSNLIAQDRGPPLRRSSRSACNEHSTSWNRRDFQQPCNRKD